MKTTQFLSFVVFASAMFAFFACSSDDNKPSGGDDNKPSAKHACYIDLSNVSISIGSDEKYGPGHYSCYDYIDQKYMSGCLMVTGGEALEECPQGYAKKCEELKYDGNNYELIGYLYRYGEKFADFKCEEEKQKANCIDTHTGCSKNTGTSCRNSIQTNIPCDEVKFCYVSSTFSNSCYLIDGEDKQNRYKSEQDCLNDAWNSGNEIYTQEQCINSGTSFGNYTIDDED